VSVHRTESIHMNDQPEQRKTGSSATESVPPRSFAVSIKMARGLLGGKSRSGIYEAAGRNELDLVKDGAKTLVTTDSIDRYNASRPRAKIKPTTPRRKATSR